MVYDTHINVRFGETDAMGHVNNVSYYIYFEQARTEFLKNLGFTIGQAQGDLNFVVVHTACDYMEQAFFDQHLIVQTYVAKVGTKSFALTHDVKDAKSKVHIARGTSVAVIIDKEKQGAMVLPDFLKEALNAELSDHKGAASSN